MHSSAIMSEDNNQRNINVTKDHVAKLEATIAALREDLSAKESYTAMLEEKLLKMSVELASSRAREDEQNLMYRRQSSSPQRLVTAAASAPGVPITPMPKRNNKSSDRSSRRRSYEKEADNTDASSTRSAPVCTGGIFSRRNSSNLDDSSTKSGLFSMSRRTSSNLESSENEEDTAIDVNTRSAAPVVCTGGLFSRRNKSSDQLSLFSRRNSSNIDDSQKSFSGQMGLYSFSRRNSDELSVDFPQESRSTTRNVGNESSRVISRRVSTGSVFRKSDGSETTASTALMVAELDSSSELQSEHAATSRRTSRPRKDDQLHDSAASSTIVW